jgi:DNA helicase HerA-like ATPase
MALIDFAGHCTVIGKTQSGKTYATQKSLKNVQGGVLFFNTMYGDLPGFTEATSKNTKEQIISLLNQGRKVNFMPSRDEDVRDKEFKLLVEKAQSGAVNQIIIAIDEVHLYGKIGTKKMIEIATTGRHDGIKGVFISQRPAHIDNTLMTQSEQFVIFKLNMEQGYLERYKMPSEEIAKKIQQGGKYAYVTYDWESLKGAYKV